MSTGTALANTFQFVVIFWTFYMSAVVFIMTLLGPGQCCKRELVSVSLWNEFPV